MKITLFTIREIGTKKLIYAEGISHAECYSDFEIAPDWFTEKDKEMMLSKESWSENSNGNYYFDEEIRHLAHYSFEKIEFNVDEEYEFINEFELKKI